MNFFLALLLLAAMLATVVALVRGIVIFLRTTEADLKGEGPSNPSLRSNKMMQQRILWQAVAIAIITVILLLASAKS